MRLDKELENLDGTARDARKQKIEAEVSALKEKALEAGGLCVIGTERHESRRIDNQLRGRSGRQGDPGLSCFFLSLEDDLMRIFGTDRMDGMLQRLGLKDGEAIVHPWINKALERAQQKVEARNFDIRKNILKYDDVMNEQRKVVFEQRIEFMRAESVNDNVRDMRHQIVDDLVPRYVPPKAYPDQWDMDGLREEIGEIYNLDIPLSDWANEEGIADEEIVTRLHDAVDRAAAARATEIGPDIMRQVEKSVLLQTLDQHWRDHLVTLEHLRQIVGLRGFGQRDPLSEFKLEAFSLFSDLLSALRQDVVRYIMRVQVETPPPVAGNAGGCPNTAGRSDHSIHRSGFRRNVGRKFSRCFRSTTIPQHGARWRAMRHARVGQAKNTNTATVPCARRYLSAPYQEISDADYRAIPAATG